MHPVKTLDPAANASNHDTSGIFHRMDQWIENRLETLSGCFAVSVCGFAVMDHRLHVLVRSDALTNVRSALQTVSRIRHLPQLLQFGFIID